MLEFTYNQRDINFSLIRFFLWIPMIPIITRMLCQILNLTNGLKPGTPRCNACMEIKYETSLIFLPMVRLWGVSGFSRKEPTWMENYTYIKLDLWQKVAHKVKVLHTRKPSLPGYDQVYKNTIFHTRILWRWDMENRCQDGFYLWKLIWRCVYGLAWEFFWPKVFKQSMRA